MADKKIKRIDAEERFYEIEGVGRFPSVTTILSVINKPAIGFWYRKQALLEVEANWEILEGMLASGMHIEDALKEITMAAKKKPDEMMQEALDIGTEAHAILEQIVKAWITKSPDPAPKPSRKEVANCVDAFFKWVEEVHFEPIESELMVYSKQYHYAGTLDAIGMVNGKLSVIDFKSSKAIYPEMGLQLAAYRHAYAEMRKKKKVNEMWILRLGKEDGSFEARQMKNPAQNMIAFKGAYALWAWQYQTKNNEKVRKMS